MASEFGIEQPVKQPPAASVPQTKRQKAGARMDKRRVAFVKGWMARRRAGHKANMKAQNKGIKKANAGARMNRRRVAFSNQQRIAARKQGRAAQGAHRGFQQMQRGRLGSIRKATAANRSARVQANKAIRAHKARIRQLTPRKVATSYRAVHRQGMKLSNLLWLARLAKKAFKKKRMDGRNHGFSGVRSGKGLTGLAGRR